MECRKPMSQHSLYQLQQVCRRRRRRVWLTATCWGVATLWVAAIVLIGIDRALGITDPLGRGLLTSLFAGLGVWIIRRQLKMVSSNVPTPLEVAHEVEHRHPALRGVVANAWEFSHPANDDLTAGSESLRRAVVLQAVATAKEVDWQQLLPRKPLRQAVLALMGVGLLLSLLGQQAPETLEIGLARLINPRSTAEWPREQDPPFVAPPPRVEQLQVTVYPPAYTRLPVSILGKGATIYTGSQLALQGRTDRPITQAALQNTRSSPAVAQVRAGGQSFEIAPTDWQVLSTDTLSLQITTANGLTTSTELSLEVIDDPPPQIRLLKPIEDLTLVPHATLPLVIEANDAFSLREIQLVYQRSDQLQAGEQRLPLWHALEEQGKRQAEIKDVRQQRVEFVWQLEPLLFVPGCVVEIRAEASDYLPQIGQTDPTLRLHIVSESQLWAQILARQARSAEKLAQLLQEQRELRVITDHWTLFPAWPTTRWAKASQRALFRQQQITDSLAGTPSSLLEQLSRLEQAIEGNGLPRPEAIERLRSAQQQLQHLVDHPLVTVEQSLSEIVRHTRQLPAQEKLQPWIAAATKHQDQTIAGLRRVIDLLLPGNVLDPLERALAEIATDQRTLAKLCREELVPQMFESQNTALDQQIVSAVRRQRTLARRLAKLTFNMTQASQQLTEKETVLADRLAATVALAQKLGTHATIQGAADQLAQRRLGRSATLQQQVHADLTKLRLQLSGQDGQKRAERYQNLQASERERKNQPPSPSEKAGESPSTSSSTHNEATRATELASARKLVKNLWGKLPNRQREQILQPLREEFLPKYAPAIEAYFRDLADPNTRATHSP